MSKSIYLVNPKPETPTYYGSEVYPTYGFAPNVRLADLTLPTVAALVPADFAVRICDEQVSTVDFAVAADYIGITGKVNQERRMVEIAREFRRRGKVVIFGGCFASLSPERLRAECDILVRGELENLAGEFFGDLRAGTWRAEYLGDRPDLSRSPVPRWDLYPHDRAMFAAVQTSRGCPFECEFCDVIQYLGRKVRNKPPAQVIAELDLLYSLGHRTIFLADDNFTASRPHARALLAAMCEWNDARTQGRVAFSTQLSIDCARDGDLLRQCAGAGLGYVFIGIETPNQASLKEVGKRQNVGLDLAAEVERFLAHGIVVSGGMIVGFDSDTRDAFERQYEFAMATPIPIFTVSPLSAPAATPLYARLGRAGRLSLDGWEATAASPQMTNIIPAQMTRAELMAGVRWLCNRLYRPEAFGERLVKMIERLGQQPPRPNSGTVDGGIPQRSVDIDRTLLAGRVLRLGEAEAAMVARISRHLEKRPWATGFALTAIEHYVQIRYMLEATGTWDAALGETPMP